ncbi:inactive serine protease 54 [Monodelphis domestica]|uniref:Serine protease 54 n=1 Tax=Monodelphis domestica TaxID=13616 RepID=F6XKM3_MONDO|nr:inactive serine protease 54 [Monodelphis domestica]
MAKQKRPLFLLLCISHSFVGCLFQSSIIPWFLSDDSDDLATVDRFPWMVSLQDSQYTHLAFGCILSEFWILSIASRLQNRKKVLALVGITDMNARRRTQPEYPIDGIFSHESFNYITMENNIALLKTYTAIEFSDQVQPICFASRNLAPSILENCWLSGWIHTAATRKRMEMGVLRKLPMQEVWPCSLKRSRGTVCFNFKEEYNSYECLGDPGNPVMCQVKPTNQWILNGVQNEGGRSCLGPFLYTKISYYSSWISKMIKKEGLDLCPVFSWRERQSGRSSDAGVELQNSSVLEKPVPDSSAPLPRGPSFRPHRPRLPTARPHSGPRAPPQREEQPQNREEETRLKPTADKKVPAMAGEPGGAESAANKLQAETTRASSKGSAEPVYYDYYSGEVMPVSGQDRRRPAREAISALCLLALVLGDVASRG